MRVPAIVFATAIASAVVSCSQAPEGSAPTPAEQIIAPGEARVGEETRGSLEGGWRVETIDGAAPTEPIPLIGTSDILYWPPACADQTIRWRGTPVGFEFPPHPDTGPRDVCSIGYPEELRFTFNRFATSTTSAVEGGGYRFEGPNGSVVIRPAALTHDGVELPPSIVGDHVVSSIDGQAVPNGQTIIVLIDDEKLTFGPQCAGFTWTYQQSGAWFSTRRPSNPEDRPSGDPPPPVCAVSVSTGERALASALDQTERIGLTDTNEIEFTGENRSVILVTQ